MRRTSAELDSGGELREGGRPRRRRASQGDVLSCKGTAGGSKGQRWRFCSTVAASGNTPGRYSSSSETQLALSTATLLTTGLLDPESSLTYLCTQLQFTDKVVVITGAGGGLGKACSWRTPRPPASTPLTSLLEQTRPSSPRAAPTSSSTTSRALRPMWRSRRSTTRAEDVLSPTTIP